jgi:hypothetical protein
MIHDQGETSAGRARRSPRPPRYHAEYDAIAVESHYPRSHPTLGSLPTYASGRLVTQPDGRFGRRVIVIDSAYRTDDPIGQRTSWRLPICRSARSSSWTRWIWRARARGPYPHIQARGD